MLELVKDVGRAIREIAVGVYHLVKALSLLVFTIVKIALLGLPKKAE